MSRELSPMDKEVCNDKASVAADMLTTVLPQTAEALMYERSVKDPHATA